MENKKILKFGLIGNGKWGNNYKKTSENLKFCKIFDITQDVKSKYKINKLDEIIYYFNNKFDGFIIATPPMIQSKILIEVLKVRSPVIVEKPISLNIKDFEQILKFKSKNQIIFVNHYHLFCNRFKTFHEKFENNSIKILKIYDGNWGPFRPDVSPIYDWAPHSLGIMFKLINSKIENVYFSKDNITKNKNIEISNLKLYVKFSSGQRVFIKTGNGFKKRKSQISVHLNDKKRYYFVNEKQSFDEMTPLEKLLNEFAISIRKNKITCNTSFNIAKLSNEFLLKNF